MNTLDLVGTNDGVLESSTIRKDEDGVRVATFGLTGAADTTAVGLHSTIESTGDLLSGIEGLGALGSRDREVGALGEKAGSGSRGSEGQDGSGDGGSATHVDGVGSCWELETGSW